MMCCSF